MSFQELVDNRILHQVTVSIKPPIHSERHMRCNQRKFIFHGIKNSISLDQNTHEMSTTRHNSNGCYPLKPTEHSSANFTDQNFMFHLSKHIIQTNGVRKCFTELRKLLIFLNTIKKSKDWQV